ncbi:CAP domain-containing protein [Peribacillus asahii]|nr:CAP-associated domain-containing protein [Peribacillus asahii]
MRGLTKILVLLCLVGFIWYKYGEDLADSNYQAAYEDMQSDIRTVINNPNVSTSLDTLQDGLDYLVGELNQVLDRIPSEDKQQIQEQVEQPNLKTPDKQSLSVYNIELGDSKEDVEKQAGTAKRSSYNEYGVKWYAYHKNYHNFFMAAYDENEKVVGLYTNQDLISAKQGIKLGSAKDTVLKQFGEPITKIRKGFVFYQLQNNDEYHLFHLDDSYVTIFYDKHEDNTVTAVQIISEELEEQKKDFYVEASPQLKEGFEFQLFDLTNAARVEHNLPALSWDNTVKETARDHSSDMAANNYFDHTNLKGQSPFDRMKEDNIRFRVAGENLAAGQLSSIFAHEGLMNSLGHRENILHNDFESLGVGVAFNSEYKPYYTENFLTK